MLYGNVSRGHEVNPLLILGVMTFCTMDMGVGTLQIGTVTVEDDRVIVPVILGGDVGSGVSSLNFRLNYNPEILQPISTEAGAAAADAQKQVLSSAKEGEYVVVMMGMNQATVQSGEVARIALRQKNNGDGQAWGLNIGTPCLSSSTGEVIESEAIPYRDSARPSSDSDRPAPRPHRPDSRNDRPAGGSGTDVREPARQNVEGVAAGPGVAVPTVSGGGRELNAALKNVDAARARIATPVAHGNASVEPETVTAGAGQAASGVETGSSPGSGSAEPYDSAVSNETIELAAVTQPAAHPDATTGPAVAKEHDRSHAKTVFGGVAAAVAATLIISGVAMRKRLFY